VWWSLVVNPALTQHWQINCTEFRRERTVYDDLYGGCTRRKAIDNGGAANLGSVVVRGGPEGRRTSLGHPPYHPETAPAADRDPPRLGQVERPHRQTRSHRRQQLDGERRRRLATDGDTAQSSRSALDVDETRRRRPEAVRVDE